ncbi:uncharacterized protein V6R79_015083 [Siganus canaliculatus]
MDSLQVFLVVVLGLICYSPGQISGTNLEVTVSPGQNVTVNCDCKISTGVYIVWYRNCSHENQPTMVLNITREWKGISHTDLQRILPRFRFEKNKSSGSYDLLIQNITKSDEGLYYCGTEEPQIVKYQYISYGTVYKYGNITTRIIVNSSEPQCHQQYHESPQDCGFCWMLLFSLCPTSALLSSLLCSVVVCLICRKKAKHQSNQVDHQKQDTGLNQVEDLCYAALEIRQGSQRPKKKRTQMSDFSTYSAINTSGMQGD